MLNTEVQTIAEHRQRWTGTEFLKNMWRDTCEGLSIVVDEDTGPTVAHRVSIGLVADPAGGVRTQFGVGIDAAVATKFTLSRRVGTPVFDVTKATNDHFDEVVAVEADDLTMMEAFLTTERRAVFLQLMLRMPSARITNNCVAVWEKGVNPDSDKAERTIERLIEAADAARPSWVDIAVDERSVLHDLFDTELDQDSITERFDTLYRGSEVSWTGELLQVGSRDRAGQRVAVLIGSADGQTSSSGRVVALTALNTDKELVVGDVVEVNGSLWNLDSRKRLFLIE